MKGEKFTWVSCLKTVVMASVYSRNTTSVAFAPDTQWCSAIISTSSRWLSLVSGLAAARSSSCRPMTVRSSNSTRTFGVKFRFSLPVHALECIHATAAFDVPGGRLNKSVAGVAVAFIWPATVVVGSPGSTSEMFGWIAMGELGGLGTESTLFCGKTFIVRFWVPRTSDVSVESVSFAGSFSFLDVFSSDSSGLSQISQSSTISTSSKPIMPNPYEWETNANKPYMADIS